MESHVRLTALITGVMTASACVIMGLISGAHAAVATGVSGAVAIGNYLLLVRDVNKMTATTEAKGFRAFTIRFFLMGFALFGMIALLKLSPVGVIVGFSMIVPGVIIGMVLGWKD